MHQHGTTVGIGIIGLSCILHWDLVIVIDVFVGGSRYESIGSLLVIEFGLLEDGHLNIDQLQCQVLSLIQEVVVAPVVADELCRLAFGFGGLIG